MQYNFMHSITGMHAVYHALVHQNYLFLNILYMCKYIYI